MSLLINLHRYMYNKNIFNIFKKKKLIIILSAGRCGSSYLINELNKIPSVNIYGENLNLFSKIILLIQDISTIIEYSKKSDKISCLKDDEKYVKGKYIYVEWYNNISKLKKIQKNLDKMLDFYFSENKYSVQGFKEFRFRNIESVKSLEYFEKKFDVYYIHLTRDIKDQSKSGFWKNEEDAESEIENINKNIKNFLINKEKHLNIDLLDIKDNVDIVKNFIKILR